MVRFTLKRKEILRGKGVFNTILKEGVTIHGTILRAHILSIPQTNSQNKSSIRVGFAVSRNVRSAVHRNRIRRLLRESYRRNKPTMFGTVESTPNLEIVLFYLPPSKRTAVLPTLSEIEEDVKLIFSSLISRGSASL